MKKSTLNIVLYSIIWVFILSQASYAYWVWTPETKKFINPKNTVKDTPKEQFEWAMGFYDAKDYQRAAFEFEKLAKQYEFSDYASRAQYYVGLCYENMQKYYIAFENYQKAIDNFPHLSNTDEVLARQYAIGNMYLERDNPKVLGNDIMAPLDRAVEIFRKVVENAPYGKYAQNAQFKLGEALKKSERYEEAVQAYHKLAEDYPNSEFATKAMYEEADCAYRASLRPAYDASATDNAIKTFEKFVDKNKDPKLAQRADNTMKRLKDNVAEKSLKAAEFYEKQGKKEAAIIYYQDIIDTYSDSSFVDKAKAKIEELKSPKEKKAFAPVDSDKKKPKPKALKVKKQPWKPLSFDSKKEAAKALKPTAAETPAVQIQIKKKEEVEAAKVETQTTIPLTQTVESPVAAPKTEIAEAPKEEESPVAAPKTEVVEAPKKEDALLNIRETKKKRSWKPFNFDNKKKDIVKESPKKKSWSPFNFGAKKEPVIKEAPKKQPWKPLSFDSKKEAAKALKPPAAETPAVQETKKKSAWKPFNFSNKEKPARPSVKEAPKKKAWKPLNFGTSDEPMGAHESI